MAYASMTVPTPNLKNQWQQVPDQNIWRNKITGIFVSVHGSSDQGWYVAKRMIPLPKDGGFGSVTTEPISPYYVTQSKPVGELGRSSRERVKREEVWRSGNFEDALNAAYTYMNNYARKIVR